MLAIAQIRVTRERTRHLTCGYGSKFNHQRTAGFSLMFYLRGFHFGCLFLTHSHVVPEPVVDLKPHGRLEALGSAAQNQRRQWNVYHRFCSVFESVL